MNPYTVQLERKVVPTPDYDHRRKATLRALARLILRVEAHGSAEPIEKLELEALPIMVAELEPELENR